MNPGTTRAEEILRLHGELEAAFKRDLATGIRIGQLLTEQRSEVPHGQWLPWLRANVLGPALSYRTCRRYVRLYDHRDDFKLASVATLTTADRILKWHGQRRKPTNKSTRGRKAKDREKTAAEDPPAIVLTADELAEFWELVDWLQEHVLKDERGHELREPEQPVLQALRVFVSTYRRMKRADSRETITQMLSRVLGDRKFRELCRQPPLYDSDP